MEFTADGKLKSHNWYSEEPTDAYKVINDEEFEMGKAPIILRLKARVVGDELTIEFGNHPEHWRRGAPPTVSSAQAGKLHGRWLLQQTTPLPTNGAFVEFGQDNQVIKDDGDRWVRTGKYRFFAEDQLELALPRTKDKALDRYGAQIYDYTFSIDGDQLTLTSGQLKWLYKRTS
jgi:hypothetical protein